MVKKCPKCGCIKIFAEFNNNSSRKDGLSDWCRKCNQKKNRENKIKNREEIRIKTKIYEQKNKEKISKRRKKNYHKTKEKKLQYQREYRAKNREKVNLNKRKYAKTYIKKRLKTDPTFRMYTNLRSRMKLVLKDNKKMHKSIELIGCSKAELIKYLEAKFQPGMTWENYGFYGWHIDHIKPLMSFDLNNKEERLKACHFSNLQPLWTEDHKKKTIKDCKIILDFKKKI